MARCHELQPNEGPNAFWQYKAEDGSWNIPPETTLWFNMIDRLFSTKEAVVFFEIHKLVDKGMAQAAIDLYDEIIGKLSRVPTNVSRGFAVLYMGKGKALHVLGRYQDAIDALTKSMEYFANNAMATMTMGDCMCAKGSFKEALEWYDRTESLKAKNDAVFALMFPFDIIKRKAAVYVAMGDLDKAVALVDKWANDGMEFMYGKDALCTRAKLRAQQGSWSDVQADYEQIYAVCKDDQVIASLLETYLMLDDLSRVREIAASLDSAETSLTKSGTLCRYFIAVSNVMKGDASTAVTDCIDLILQMPPPMIEWNFLPLQKHLEARIDEPIKAFLLIMQQWIAGEQDIEPIKTAAITLGQDVDAINAALGQLTLEEAGRIAKMIHAEIMAIPLIITDEQFKVDCTMIGDDMFYKGVVYVGKLPSNMAILMNWPYSYRHPEDIPGFEQSRTFKEMVEIGKAIGKVHERYRKFLKIRGAGLEMMGDIDGTTKEWLTPESKNWTLSERVTPEQRNIMEKMKATKEQAMASPLSIAGITSAPVEKPVLVTESAKPIVIPNGSDTSPSVLQHDSIVCAATYSPDGKLIATASGDNTCCLWDAGTGEKLHTFGGHANILTYVTFSPDGKYLATSSFDASVRIWNVESKQLLHQKTGFTKLVSHCAFSPDGTKILITTHTGEASVWETASMDLFRSFGSKTAAPVIKGEFFKDGKYLYIIAQQRFAEIFTLSSFAGDRRSLEGHTAPLTGGAVNPNGDRIATISMDASARIYDSRNRNMLHVLSGHKLPIIAVNFSPDGKILATGSADKTVRLWDAKKGKLFYILEGHKDTLSGLAFSPDSQYLLTTSNDMTAKLWSVKTGKLIFTLEGHQSWVCSPMFSPDGHFAITASGDNTARIWDLHAAGIY